MKEKEKENKDIVDKNFFNSMSYELAGEIGVIDNEDMINNKKIPKTQDEEKQNKKGF